MLNRYVCDKMFDISVLSRCSLTYDPLLECPFNKALNGACFILVRCIPAKVIAFRKISHDFRRTESLNPISQVYFNIPIYNNKFGILHGNLQNRIC